MDECKCNKTERPLSEHEKVMKQLAHIMDMIGAADIREVERHGETRRTIGDDTIPATVLAFGAFVCALVSMLCLVCGWR